MEMVYSHHDIILWIVTSAIPMDAGGKCGAFILFSCHNYPSIHQSILLLPLIQDQVTGVTFLAKKPRFPRP